MQVLKHLNNVSPELIKECIPEFRRDEVKTFRMLNGVANNNPDIVERLKRPTFYPDTQIRTWDRIFDPYLVVNGRKGGYVDIGVVENFDIATERPTKFKLFVRGQNIGMFSLRGDIVADVEMYEFLCLSNENASFKHRDTSVTPLFEEIIPNPNQESEDDDLLLEALSGVKKLKPPQKRELSVLLHIDTTLDDKGIQSALNQLAKSTPKDVLDKIEHLKKIPTRKGKAEEAVA